LLCRLGVNAKVINSVIHDSVVVGDGVTVQNTILCSGVVVREKATLKDCQVASGFTISAGIEHKGEVLAKKA
jgi:translation initiation factor eIF-2B subunit gamma